jgi:hypothetical protein
MIGIDSEKELDASDRSLILSHFGGSCAGEQCKVLTISCPAQNKSIALVRYWDISPKKTSNAKPAATVTFKTLASLALVGMLLFSST